MSGTFSEDEARQIFARAAERQHAAATRGEELSLDELQAIGAEAGLDPAHVAAAVAELRAGPPHEPAVVGGIDLTPRRVRVLPVPLTDDLWAEMVLRLRRTYGTPGLASEIGPLREWRSGPTSRLHVVAEPVEGGTRVTIETSRAGEGGTPQALGLGGTALAALIVILGTAKGALADPAIWVFVGVFLMLGVVGAFASRESLRRWSARRADEFVSFFEDLEASIELASFHSVIDSSSPEPDVREARVDPGLLDGSAPEAPFADGAPAPRARRRA